MKCSTFMLAFALANGSQAVQAQPSLVKDLDLLYQQWTSLEKVQEGFVTVEPGFGAFSSEQNGLDRYETELELFKATNPNEKILHIHSGFFEENVQESIFSVLFQDETVFPKFCSVLPKKEVKIPPRNNYTEEEKALLQKNFDYARCRKVFKGVLGGIIKADTKVQYFHTQSAQNSSQGRLVLWVYSMADEAQYLTYRFDF